ncbi:hypothetical protein JT321_gp04 [Providencia phage Kokobel1]|uniref:Uncharacterized protein n=1 Tax=Providencia phage Kokobel1 TaxID=2783540 RepID=A0A873WJI7_9CAUD|nr:hypothetical protein JT321_gp04 [Providencia phage Kokobel1]QPB11431.1 hypothetical protein [Providencia phage Kokobel1]
MKTMLYVLLVIIAAAAGVGTYLAIGSTSCSSYGEANKQATEYRVFEGCGIKTSDGWQKISFK